MNSNQEQRDMSIGVMELLTLVRRYLALIIIAGIIGGALTFAVCSLFVDPVYEASAMMIVNSRTEETETVTNDQITSSQKLADTYAIIIRSRTVLNSVIEKLHLDMSYEKLQKMVTVVSVNDTQIMEIAVQSKDPQQALQIVEEILVSCPDIIIEAVEAGSVKTVEEAYLQNKPVAPNTNLYTLVAAFLCMMAVMAVVVIGAVMDNTYKSDIDLRNDLDLPVLGVIPDYESCLKQTHSRK